MLRVSRFLGSRLALNLYFWLFLLFLKYEDLDDQTHYSYGFYFGMMLFYMALIAGFSYFNNLVLQPRLLYRRKTVAFYLLTVVWVVFFSYFYSFIIIGSEVLFPKLEGEHLSVLTVSIPGEFRMEAILELGNSYMPVFFFWTVIFGLAGMNFYRSRENKRMMDALNQYRETELTLLRQQLNPHFLFNTLNNLYSLSLENSKRASESILQLSAVLRYILYESSGSQALFSKEREIMQAYIDIELLRLEESADMRFSIVSDGDKLIPPLLWLPVLENVFKHTRSISSPEIDFRFQLQEDELTVFCRNSRSEQILSDRERVGIGLENIRKRLELLFPGQHQMAAYAENGYFITDIRVKLA